MFEAYKKLLAEFVALQSVSTDSAFLAEIKHAAQWLEKLFRDQGFRVTVLTDPDCNPIIVAHYDAGLAETLLVYGHYDVQPAEMEQGWNTDPFTLNEKSGRFFGRGATDNKGQILVHMVAAFETIRKNALRTNLTFIIEGNEETANPVLPGIIARHTTLLRCDEILVSDGTLREDRPTIEAGCRGGYNLRIQLRTAPTDIHSGKGGGMVPSATAALAHLLAGLADERGKVLIKDFYKDVPEVDSKIAALNAELANHNDFAKQFGVKKLISANQTDFYTQIGLYPTLQISGVQGGYTGSGFANIIPATAEARLNIRVVAGQDVGEHMDNVKQELQNRLPDYVEAVIETFEGHNGVSLDTETPSATRAAQILEEAYGSKVIYSYAGGSIPIVVDLKRILGVDPLLVSIGNADSNIHGANENLKISLVEKALAFSYAYMSKDS